MTDYFIFILYCTLSILIQCFALRKSIITKDERIWFFLRVYFGELYYLVF